MKISVLYKLRRMLQVLLLRATSDETMSKLYFRIILGYKANLRNPRTFNEKLQWLKLFYFPKSQLAIQCTDKYLVREYITAMELTEHLNVLYGFWDNAEDIAWNELPNQFVLKCTHGCGYNILCADKDSLDTSKAVKQLNKWLKEDFGAFNAEPHYSPIKGRIICEKYLGGDMTDYKFFCFNGKIEFMYIVKRAADKRNTLYTTCFYEDGTQAPFKRTEHSKISDPILPFGFEEMKEMSLTLSRSFPFVRVDWFEVDSRIYFSELTFTPGGAMLKLDPPEYDGKLGELLDISSIIEAANG